MSTSISSGVGARARWVRAPGRTTMGEGRSADRGQRVVADAGRVRRLEVGLPEVRPEHLVLDVPRGHPAVDQGAPDPLHERQRAAQVVGGALGQLYVVEVHDSGM